MTRDAHPADAALLQAQVIEKRYGGTQALHGVSLALRPGEVHAVVGENGAGKSTLMKILSGVERPTSGALRVRGRDVRFRGVHDAELAGIAMIHQEQNLVDELSAAANIFLGRERTRLGLLDRASMRDSARELLRRVGSDVDPDVKVRDLSIAQRQLVEIAKAVSINASVLIMDDPTAVLTRREVEALFGLIDRLRASGVAVVYISHILPEVIRLADRVTVMRDGRVVASLRRGEAGAASAQALASLMVGRAMADHFPPRHAVTGGGALRIANIRVADRVRDVSFDVSRGEIFGLAGLIGAGRTELGEAIAGLRPRSGGAIELDGKVIGARTPRDAVSAGIAYLSEDRKSAGLTLGMSITENVTLVSLRNYAHFGIINKNKEQSAARSAANRLRLRASDLSAPVSTLSGGNQQKVALAKWLEVTPKVLILDEPTRGVDIGAKEEIYRLIAGFASSGMICIVISSEMNELLGLCHRIGVMRAGRLVATLDGATANERQIMYHAAGVEAATA